MAEEQVISEENREITVYQEMTDLVKKQLYDLLTKIESIGDTGSKECIKICKEIKDLICRQIQVCVSSDDKLSAYSGRYREIGHGSTSYCYSLVDDDSSSVLVKEFHPTRYAKEDISLCDSNGCASIPQCGLYWIADSARDDVDKVKSFLTDFARFIKQETRIVSIIKDSHKSGSDSFFNPKLYISSVGLIYLDTALCGKMLNDAIGGIDEKGYSLSAIIDRFEMILRIAQSVAVYHDNGYFNGDLKPSNLFQIEAEGKQKIIRNIDFDTCVNVEKDIKDKSYFEKDIRTTRIFYSPTGIRLLGMDINEKDDETLKQARNFLLKFDVSAIANILIYAFLSKERREELINEKYELAFKNYGFYGRDGKENVVQNLFDALGCKNSLARLAIFKEIHNLIFNSLDEGNGKKCDIHGFIKQVNVIIAMLKSYDNNLLDFRIQINDDRVGDYLRTFDSYIKSKDKSEQAEDYISSQKILYFVNLHRLDNMISTKNIPFRLEDDVTIEYEYSPDLKKNTPKDYIKKIFYEE